MDSWGWRYNTLNNRWRCNWSAQTSGTANWLISVTFVNAATGWAVGGNGTILNTTNGGANWNAQISGTTFWFYSVNFPNTATGWAVGDNGIIRKTTNAGVNWAAQTGGTNYQLASVNFVNDTVGWCAGIFGTILKTTNGGLTFIKPTSTGLPDKFQLFQNYPNPFNPVTTIEYSLPRDRFVHLSIFDILGREVEVIVNEKQIPGTYEVQFDGSKFASGMIFKIDFR